MHALALPKFGADRRGVSTVEFGFIAMLLVLLMTGIIEFAGIMFATVLIEGGLREASRAGITGFIPAGSTREQFILDTIQANGAGMIDTALADIDTLIYPSFDSIGQPEPFTDSNADGQFTAGETFQDINGNGQWDSDMGTAGLGGPGDIVLYRVTYDWPLLTGLLNHLIGQDGKMRLTGSIVVRNEPF